MRFMSESVLPMSSPSEVSQTEKEKYCMTSLICGIFIKQKIQMNTLTKEKETHRLRQQT